MDFLLGVGKAACNLELGRCVRLCHWQQQQRRPWAERRALPTPPATPGLPNGDEVVGGFASHGEGRSWWVVQWRAMEMDDAAGRRIGSGADEQGEHGSGVFVSRPFPAPPQWVPILQRNL